MVYLPFKFPMTNIQFLRHRANPSSWRAMKYSDDQYRLTQAVICYFIYYTIDILTDWEYNALLLKSVFGQSLLFFYKDFIVNKNQHIALLVVENNETHVQDLTKMLDLLSENFPLDLEVQIVGTLAGAMALMRQADWVMTDVFFPSVPNGDATEPNGMKIVEACIAARKPCVVVTDQPQGVHSEMSEWAHGRGLELFGSKSAEQEMRKKPWKNALYSLIFIALGLKDGNCDFTDGRLIRKFAQFDHELYKRGLYYFPGLIEHYLSDEPLVTHVWPTLGRMFEAGFPRE